MWSGVCVIAAVQVVVAVVVLRGIVWDVEQCDDGDVYRDVDVD